MTNMIITPNQTQSHCPEDPRFTDNHCTTDKDCTPLEPVRNGNGRIVPVLFLPKKAQHKAGLVRKILHLNVMNLISPEGMQFKKTKVTF